MNLELQEKDKLIEDVSLAIEATQIKNADLINDSFDKDNKINMMDKQLLGEVALRNQVEAKLKEAQYQLDVLAIQSKERDAQSTASPNEQAIRFEGLIREYKKTIEDFRSQLLSSEASLSQLQERNKKAEDRSKSLADANERLSMEVKDIEEALERSNLQKTELMEEQASYFGKIIEELGRDIKDKDSKIKDKDIKLKETEGRVSELNKQIKDKDFVLTNLENTKKKNEDAIKANDDKIKALSNELSSLKESVRGEANENAKKLLGTQKELQESKRLNTDLSSQINKIREEHSASTDTHTVQYNIEIEKIRQTLIMAQEQLRQQEGSNKNLLKDLGDSNNQIENLKTQNESLRRAIEGDVSDSGLLKRRIAELENDIGDRDVKLRGLGVENRNISSTAEKMKKELDRTNERINILNENDIRGREELKKRNDEYSKLKDEYESNKRSGDLTTSDNERLKDTVSKLRQNLDIKAQEHSETSKFLSEFKERLREANRLNESVRSEAEGLRRRTAEADGQVPKLKEQIVSLRDSESTLKKKNEDLRQKIDEASKLYKRMEIEVRNKLLDKDKQIKSLSQSLSNQKEAASGRLKEQKKLTTTDFEDLQQQYEQQIEGLNDEILRLKEDHMSEIEEMTEIQLKQLKETIIKNNEFIKKIKQESDEETGRMTQRIEELLNRIKDIHSGASASDSSAHLQELFSMKLDQETASIERKYRTDLDNLLSDKVDQQKEISSINREITRLRELNEDLKNRLRGGYGAPSLSNSRSGSINMLKPFQQEGVQLAGVSIGNTRPISDKNYKSDLDSTIPFPNKRVEGEGIKNSGGQQLEILRGQGIIDDNITAGDEEEMEIVSQETEKPVYQTETHQNIKNIDYGSTNNSASPDLRGKKMGDTDLDKLVSPGRVPLQQASRKFGPQEVSKLLPNSSQGGFAGQGDALNIHPGYRGFIQNTETTGPSLGRGKKQMGQWPQKDKPLYMQTLTNLRKARILNNALTHILSNHKIKTFYLLSAAKIKYLRGWGEAGTRIKGRLILMLKTRYADAGARRCFYKWAMLSKPDFVRACIMKIALTSKLTDHSVFWRFRKGIMKRLKSKIPESAKSARFVLGSHLLHFLFKLKQVKWRIESISAMRPKVIGKENRIMINLLNKKNAREKMALIKSVRQLQAYSYKKEMMINRLAEWLKEKVARAYFSLKEINETHKIVVEHFNNASDLAAINAAFKRVVIKNVTRSLGLDKIDRVQQKTQLFTKYINISIRNDLESAVDRLRHFSRTMAESERRKKRMTRRIFNAFTGKTQDRVRESFSILSHFHGTHEIVEQVRKVKYLKTQTESRLKLRGIFNGLTTSTFSKVKSVFDELLINKISLAARSDKILATQKRRENLKVKILSKLFKAQNEKRTTCFNRIVDNCRAKNNTSVFRNKKLLSLLTRLSSGQRGKQRNSLNRLRLNKSERISLDQITTSRKSKNAWLMTLLLNKIVSNFTNKQKNSLHIMRERVSRILMSKQKKDRIINNTLNRLLTVSHFKTRICYSVLVQNRLENIAHHSKKSDEDKRRIQVVKKLANTLVSSYNSKMKTSVESFIHNNKDYSDKSTNKRRKLQLAANRLNRAQSSKLYLLFNKLRDYQIGSKKEEQTVNTRNDANRVRRSRLLNRLVKSMIGKQAQANEILSNYHKKITQKQSRDNRRTYSVLSKLVVASQVKDRICFATLVQNRLEQVAEEDRLSALMRYRRDIKTKFISRIIKANLSKYTDGLMKLVNHNNAKMVSDGSRKKKLAALLNRLVNTSNTKSRISLILLNQHRFETAVDAERHRVTTQRRQGAKNRIISRLVQSTTRKLHSGFDLVVEFGRDHIALERKVNKAFFNMLVRLPKASEFKARVALNLLVSNRLNNMAEQDRIQEKRRKRSSAKSKILSRLVNCTLNKLKDALGRLRTNNEKLFREEKSRRKKISELWNRASVTLQIKTRIAFTDLIQNRLEIIGEEDRKRGYKERERIIKNGFLHKLRKSLFKKTAMGLEKLKDNGKLEGSITNQKNRRITSYLRKLISAQEVKKRIMYSGLHQNSLEVERDNKLKSHLLLKLVNAYVIKSDLVIERLKDHTRKEVNLRGIKSKSLISVVSRSISSSNVKMRIAFNTLTQHRHETNANLSKWHTISQQTSTLNNRFVSKIVSSLSRRVGLAMKQLEQHRRMINKNEELTRKKILRIINKIGSASDIKLRISINTMKLNKSVESFKGRRLLILLNRLVLAQTAKSRQIVKDLFDYYIEDSAEEKQHHIRRETNIRLQSRVIGKLFTAYSRKEMLAFEKLSDCRVRLNDYGDYKKEKIG